jgi:uncharacterized membrane protein YdbT with pleckstrin-like domain
MVSLAATVGLLIGTGVPHVWPTVTFLAFLGLFVKALVRYYQNTLTTYYVTRDRIVSEYRFLPLNRTSINHEDVANVSRRQSAVETLTGLGSVRVSVAGGQITLRDLGDPGDAERLLTPVRT